MDMEQIIKQVDWLDEERRKDKTKLGSFEERLIALEENVAALASQIKDLSSEVNRFGAINTRMDGFDESLLKQRIESKKYFDEMERQIQKNQDENEKIRRVEFGAIDSRMDEVQKKIDYLPDLQRRIDSRIEEENRLSRSIEEIRNKLDEVRRSDEEYTRTIRLLEDGRRQETKRLTDLQGETIALRKRIDEISGKSELNSVATRKLESRMNEIDILETERREIQDKFIENQTLQQVEREREWKEWQTRFNQIEQQTLELEENIQALELTHRDVKRATQNIDELTQKVDRRINEITEIQRLSEERFRQDWVTFKADDQKRWTNYSLTQDEQRNETRRQQEIITNRLTDLEDTVQEINDLVQQAHELSEKRIQSLRAVVHEWVTEFERSISSHR